MDFNLSNGIIMILKSFVKSSASLFIPELSRYIDLTIEEAKNIQKVNTSEHDFDNVKSAELTESNMLLVKSLVLKQIFENDRLHYPTTGIFRQFCYDKGYDDEPLANNKFNLRTFRSTVQQLKNIYKYKVQEETT